MPRFQQRRNTLKQQRKNWLRTDPGLNAAALTRHVLKEHQGQVAGQVRRSSTTGLQPHAEDKLDPSKQKHLHVQKKRRDRPRRRLGAHSCPRTCPQNVGRSPKMDDQGDSLAAPGRWDGHPMRGHNYVAGTQGAQNRISPDRVPQTGLRCPTGRPGCKLQPWSLGTANTAARAPLQPRWNLLGNIS